MTNLSDVFEDFSSNCDVLVFSLQQAKDPSIQPCEYDMQDFHLNVVSFSKILSHEATKFAIAHSSPPFPEVSTTQTLAGNLCNSASQLIGCYLLLPYSCGSTFLNVIQKELELLVISVKQFAETIHNLIVKNETLQPCLLTTGILWEFCDRLPTLPQNNKEAVVFVLSREEQLIKDAIEELEQVVEPLGDINCGSDDDSTISGPAIELLPSVRGLIKTAAALIRRTKKLVNDFHDIDATKLDPIVEIVSTLSTEVDDLACSLYAPIDVAEAAEHGSALSSKMSQLLCIVKGIANEDDKSWIDLLSKAALHNLENLQTKASLA